MTRLQALWNDRSPRERVMLLALAAVLAGVAVWLAVQGLAEWRQAAEDRARRAAAGHAAVAAGAALTRRAREQAPPGGLEALIREAAEANGLEPAMTTVEADGAVTVSFEAAASPALFAWLAQIEAQGVRVAGFTALKTPEGALQARVILAPAP